MVITRPFILSLAMSSSSPAKKNHLVADVKGVCVCVYMLTSLLRCPDDSFTSYFGIYDLLVSSGCVFGHVLSCVVSRQTDFFRGRGIRLLYDGLQTGKYWWHRFAAQ